LRVGTELGALGNEFSFKLTIELGAPHSANDLLATSSIVVAPITAVTVTIPMRVVVIWIVCCVLLISVLLLSFVLFLMLLWIPSDDPFVAIVVIPISPSNFLPLLSLAVLGFVAPKFC
jgi:hypothetical protein